METLLHLQDSASESAASHEKQQAQFNYTCEAVASVIREKINDAVAKDDKVQVGNMCSEVYSGHFSYVTVSTQVMTYGKLFPKLGLSHEGLNKICQYLCKVVLTYACIKLFMHILD